MGQKKASFSTHHINAAIQDKVKLFSEKY